MARTVVKAVEAGKCVLRFQHKVRAHRNVGSIRNKEGMHPRREDMATLKMVPLPASRSTAKSLSSIALVLGLGRREKYRCVVPQAPDSLIQVHFPAMFLRWLCSWRGGALGR